MGCSYPVLTLVAVSMITNLAGGKSPMVMTPCDEARDCSECMATSPECIWCLEVPLVNQRPQHQQCQLRNQSRCLHIEGSTEESVRVTTQKALALKPRVPISPQKAELFLRKGATAKLSFTVFTRKENFEVTFKYPKVFDVTVQSKCNGFEWKKKKASCSGVSPGKVQFEMIVRLKRCPKKPKKIRAFVPLNNKKRRSLKVKVITKCSCDCDTESRSERKSIRCSKNGDYVCGACRCDKGFYGMHCECDPENVQDMCTSPSDGSICSNRGQCVCGQCECGSISPMSAMRYTGRYCECDDYSCGYYNGQICGGPSRGRCACGVCQCFEEFQGSVCQISRESGGCLSTRSGNICNNVGVCVDNKCVCLGNNRGPTCDECSAENPWDCTTTCVGLRPCVECMIFRSGSLNMDECISQCTMLRIEMVDNVVVKERGGREFKLCMLRDSDFCLMKFGYDFTDDDSTQVRVERTRMCPEP